MAFFKNSAPQISPALAREATGISMSLARPAQKGSVRVDGAACSSFPPPPYP
jgi:hypothetical protein